LEDLIRVITAVQADIDLDPRYFEKGKDRMQPSNGPARNDGSLICNKRKQTGHLYRKCPLHSKKQAYSCQNNIDAIETEVVEA
jgi:hypothetical protein